MTPSEPLSFGRKIKELKKINKKGYAELTAGLKMSRERIIALEEGEREPTDVERQRFAAFYNLPVEEFLPKNAPAVSQPVSRVVSGNTAGYASNPNPVRPQGNFAPGGPRPANPPVRPVSADSPRPAPVPKPPAAPKEVRLPDIEDVKPGDSPKPVMKYTAEQLGDIESAYLRKQRDLKVPLTFTFMNGKEFTGVVSDFTPFTIHILDPESGEEIVLRKLAIAYYRKADAFSERGDSEKGS